MKIGLRSVIAGVSAVLVAVVLAACASTSSGDVMREASIRSSNLCIVNDSSTKMTIWWQGYPDRRDIPAGGSQCNSGREPVGSDVRGVIDYEPAGYPGARLAISVLADNHFLAAPQAAAAVQTKPEEQVGACGAFRIGQSRGMETGWLHGELKRSEDSDKNIEFVLTLTDNVGPTSGQLCRISD